MEEFKSFYETVSGGEGNKCKYPTRLDTYGCGCQHNCKYCYAKSLLSFRKLWNAKEPAVADINKIEKTIQSIQKGTVVRLGGMTDCFQPLEKEIRNTYKTIQLLNRYGIEYLIVTKSSLVAEYINVLDKKLAHIQITVTCTDDGLYKKLNYEQASLPSERIKAIPMALSTILVVAVSMVVYVYGEMIANNDGKSSYREGIELEGAWKPCKYFRWDLNATFSRSINKNWKQSTVLVDDQNKPVYDDSYNNVAGENVNLGNTHTAFSPDVIVNNILTFTYNGFNASVQSQYVGEQYLTNTDFKNMICHDENGNETIETLMLKDHFTTNVDLSYNFSLKKFGIKSANVGVTFYNIFNTKYDNNGWGAPQIAKTKDGSVIAFNDWGTRDKEAAGFAPSAPFNWMAHLSINF